jgi:hypothetical protein
MSPKKMEVLASPQPLVHKSESKKVIPWRTKLSLDGSLLFYNLQEKRDTFKGAILFRIIPL